MNPNNQYLLFNNNYIVISPNRTEGLKIDLNSSVIHLINNPNIINDLIDNIDKFTIEEKLVINLLLLHIYLDDKNNIPKDKLKKDILHIISKININSNDSLAEDRDFCEETKKHITYSNQLNYPTLDQTYDKYIKLIDMYNCGFEEGHYYIWSKICYMNNNIKTKLINHNFIISISILNMTSQENILKRIFADINSFNEFKYSENKNDYIGITQNEIEKYKLINIIKKLLSDNDFEIFKKLYKELMK